MSEESSGQQYAFAGLATGACFGILFYVFTDMWWIAVALGGGLGLLLGSMYAQKLEEEQNASQQAPAPGDGE